MKRLAISVLCVFLALLFIMSVYTYGTNERYSFISHLENIADEFEETPSVEELISYWTGDKFKPSYNGIEFYPEAGSPGFSGDAEDDGYIYPNKVTDGDWGVLQPLQEFVGAVKGFFVRLYYSILWVCNFVVHIFFLVGVILPWNGLVPREEEASSVFYKEVAA